MLLNSDTPSVIHTGSHCAHCQPRHKAPCGAIKTPNGLSLLDGSHSKPRAYAPNAVIFEQGDVTDHSYTVTSGWVALCQTLRDGRAFIRRFAMPGDVLSSELNAEFHAYAAVAVGDVVVCSISRARRERLEQEHPAYRAREDLMLEQELERAYETAASSALNSARERIARLFWDLACRALGRAPLKGESFKAPLSQIQIGMATCLTPVHVSRTLRALREDGLAHFDAHRITILEPTKLGSMAGALGDTDSHGL